MNLALSFGIVENYLEHVLTLSVNIRTYASNIHHEALVKEIDEFQKSIDKILEELRGIEENFA